MRPRRLVRTRREVLTTPDDDDLVVDHLDATAPRAHLLLLHGLEGSTNSVYMQGMLSLIQQQGCSASALNFRSCARHESKVHQSIPNRRPRFYHSGETSDFDFLVRTMAARLPSVPLVAIGTSLGGNVLLKWLGETRGTGPIRAGAAISVPFDLGAGALYMERGFARFYIAAFVRTLATKVRRAVENFPDAAKGVDLRKATAAKTFREFDDAATAPLHGFRDADDYYRRSSSISFLSSIRTPVLCISAQDDPFLPPAVLDLARERASDFVEFSISERGGHAGFVNGRAPWRARYWAEEIAVRWVLARSESTPAAGTRAPPSRT